MVVGIWMEYQFAKSAAQQAIADHAHAEMSKVAGKIYPSVDAILKPGTGSVESYRQVRDAFVRADLGANSAILVDSEWRPLTWVGNGAAAGSEPIQGGTIHWRAALARGERVSTEQLGTIAFGGQAYIAVARTVGENQWSMVLYQSPIGMAPLLTEFLETLPALQVMTIIWTCALLSIVVYLVSGKFYDEVEREQKQVSAASLKQTQNLIRTRDAVIFGLAKLADSRDPETGDHLERISTYSTTLASCLRRHPKFRDEVTPSFVRIIGISSALHDIGKVGIEDSILRKPEGLTEDERQRMQLHPGIGAECLGEIEQRLGSSNFLQMAREIALAHHERWDGAGYPNGMAGGDIPLSARIVAIADVYDALSCKRVYKRAVPHSECVAIIASQAGKHFDADIIEAWLTIEGQFREIALQYGVGLVQPESADESPSQTQGETVITAATEFDVLMSGRR